jgi:hypoxanthine phosphoribosyltransferase
MRADEPIQVPAQGLEVPGGPARVPPALADRIDRVLIPEEALAARVEALAGQIGRDLSGSARLTLLVVLDGAFVFAADLGRALCRLGGPEVSYDFVRARTYGEEIKREGETERGVTLLVEPEQVVGQDVVLVEDILDQGFTLTRIRQHVLAQQPASLRTCVLLSKRLKRPTTSVRELRDHLDATYIGFEVPDRWVAGYGIDAGGDFRELPYVVAVRESYYQIPRDAP